MAELGGNPVTYAHPEVFTVEEQAAHASGIEVVGVGVVGVKFSSGC
jgi:hypothetical protein